MKIASRRQESNSEHLKKTAWQRTAPYKSVQRMHNTKKHPNREGHFTPEAV